MPFPVTARGLGANLQSQLVAGMKSHPSGRLSPRAESVLLFCSLSRTGSGASGIKGQLRTREQAQELVPSESPCVPTLLGRTSGWGRVFNPHVDVATRHHQNKHKAQQQQKPNRQMRRNIPVCAARAGLGLSWEGNCRLSGGNCQLVPLSSYTNLTPSPPGQGSGGPESFQVDPSSRGKE